MPGTRKLGRATAHRTAMLRAMVTFLLENGKIETTVTRAKEVSSLAEKMITIAKENNLHNKRMVMSFVTKEDVVYISCSARLPRSMPTGTAAIRVLQSSAPAGETRPKWQ